MTGRAGVSGVRVSFARVTEALQARGLRARVRGDHADSQCPAHEDHSPSLSVDWQDRPEGGRVQMHCHAGCHVEDVASALGLTLADLFDQPPAEREHRHSWRRVAEYVYVTADGEPVGRVVRSECDCRGDKGKRTKRFMQARPTPAGGWEWKSPEPSRRVLYRLPEVAAAIAAGCPVYVVEGEKAADALAGAGVPATTNPGGAGKWLDHYPAALRGADVVIVADRDAKGCQHAATVRASLINVARSVRVVESATTRESDDAFDHLAAGYSVDDFAPVPESRLAPPAPEDRALREAIGGESALVEWDRYAVTDAGLVKVSERRPRGVLDAVARIERRVLREMGDGSHDGLVDLSVRRGDDVCEIAGVPWEDFERISAWEPRLPWPIQYKRTAAGRSDAVNAIMATSGAPEMVTEYGILGWREIDGEWLYLHAGGAIGAAGSSPGVRVGVPDDLAIYALPDPPADPDGLRAALASVLAILDELPARIAAPLVGGALRAALGDTGASVYLVGGTGGGKTGLAALAQQFYAPSVRYNLMPFGAGEAAATMAGLEHLRYVAGHSVFVLDDLAPDRSAERAAARAGELVRSQHNRTGKVRGRRDGGTRPVHRPRGLLILTGEDGAGAESAENRTHYVPVSRGDVDLAALADLSTPEHRRARAALTAALAHWWAPRMPADGWVDLTRGAYAEAFRQAKDGPESRRAETAADLALGWRAVLDMATDRGVLDSAAAEAVWRRAWDGLAESLIYQTRMTARRTLPERAADYLRSALLSGRGHVTNRAGDGPPDVPELWGWEIPRPSPWTAGTEPPRPRGRHIGWTDGGRLYLDTGAAFAILEEQARAEADPWNITKRAFGAVLVDSGIVRVPDPNPRGRSEVGVRVGGSSRRVWDLPVSWLYDDDTTPPAPAEPTPPPAPAPHGPDRSSNPPHGPQTAEPTPPATGPTPTPRMPAQRPRGAVEGRFRAPAVVLDTDGAHWPDATVTESPAFGSLAEVLAWAEGQPLGHPRAFRRGEFPDDPQVWIMPDLARRLGFPQSGPAKDKPIKSHRLLTETRAAGWQIPDLNSWLRAWREGGRTIRVVLPGWETDRECPLLAGDPGPGELAYRLALYAQEVGIAYRLTPGITGLDLLRAFPRRLRLQSVDEHPPPAMVRHLEGPASRDLQPEVDYGWRRPATPDELRARFVHAYDVNAMYVAAAASMKAPLGPARHVDAAAPFDRATPAYWRVERMEWAERLMPDLFTPGAQPRGRTQWLTTPTLALAAELGFRVEPVEAYVYDERGRFLEPWAHRLRDARAALAARGGDPDAQSVLAAVKLTYAEAIGHFDRKSSARELWHPEWRHLIIATARANLHRKLTAVAESTGRHPLAVLTDCVLYASDDPDAVSACPPGLTIGTGLGQVKVEGSAGMAEVAEWLADPRSRDTERVMQAIKDGSSHG